MRAENTKAKRLVALLDEEFEALKAQDLNTFEALQPEKAAILQVLSNTQIPAFLSSGTPTPVDPAASAATANPIDTAGRAEWETFQQLIVECRDRHRRNSILIQRKLDAIRAALKTLQGADPTSSVEIYDRLGRVATGRKKSGYADA